MKRLATLAFLLVGAELPATPGAALYYGFTIGITNAPPAPVVHAEAEPRLVRCTDAMVYVVRDDDFDCNGDTFRYGQYWFVYSGNFWYRARSYRGPFVVIDVRKVPRAVLGVPRKMWKHHPLGGPPGQVKRQVIMAGDDGDTPGHGHGHGHGHDR